VNSSLRSRIRNGILLVLIPVLLVGVFTVPSIWHLGTATEWILQENYISIEASQHMEFALHNLQVAELQGKGPEALPGLSNEFRHWLNIELNTLTEIGEPETARDIDSSAHLLFNEVASAPPGTHHDAEFDHLFSRLNFLIRLNENALWRDQGHAVNVGREVVSTITVSLTIAILLALALSWTISRAIARPLTTLAAQLHDVGEHKHADRLGQQDLSELQTVAASFNQMVDQLDYYERLNVDRLLFEKSKIEAIIHRLEDGVVLIDAEGKIAHINEVAANVLGVQVADTMGKPFAELPSKAPGYLRLHEELRVRVKDDHAGEPIELELQVRGRDHTFMAKPMRLSEGQYALGTLLILQDVTYIRDQDRARTNLVATLSHELRTPLTSLGLAAQLLDQDKPVPLADRRKLIKTILSEFTRLSELIDELLDLSRGRVPSMGMRRVRFGLAKIIEDLARRLAIQADEKQITLDLNVSPLPEVFGDPVKISWVVSNLITNALRYTPRGGRVEVTARPMGSQAIHMEVKDTGPGIAADIREHIFERFAQYTVDGQPPGSVGLGLAIAKDIVNAHAGRLFVESDGQHGSRFIVELPTTGEA
jgi:two-component system, NtrC family, sensor histidine kinase KinB